MRLNAPKQIVFLVSLVLGILGVLTGLGVVPAFALSSFWLLTIAWGVLTAGTLLKGL